MVLHAFLKFLSPTLPRTTIIASWLEDKQNNLLIQGILHLSLYTCYIPCRSFASYYFWRDCPMYYACVDNQCLPYKLRTIGPYSQNRTFLIKTNFSQQIPTWMAKRCKQIISNNVWCCLEKCFRLLALEKTVFWKCKQLLHSRYLKYCKEWINIAGNKKWVFTELLEAPWIKLLKVNNLYLPIKQQQAKSNRKIISRNIRFLVECQKDHDTTCCWDQIIDLGMKENNNVFFALHYFSSNV